MLQKFLKLETQLNNEKNLFYKSIHLIIDRINFAIPFRHQGFNYILPFIYGMGFYHLLKTEAWLKPFMARIFEIKDGSFIDVGANIGQTLLRFKSLRNNQSYLGFEPNNGSYLYLAELIRINKFENCEIFPFALSDKCGLNSFYRRHRTDVSSTLVKEYKTFANSDNQINVPTIKGDDVVRQYKINNLSLIKIDVEGGELEVLGGFEQTLLNLRPMIICEILPVYHLESENLRTRLHRQQKLLSKLKELNYSVYRIQNGERLKRLDQIEVHGKLSDSNYLFVPNELADKIKAQFYCS